MACEAEHMYMHNAHVRDVQFKPKVNTWVLCSIWQICDATWNGMHFRCNRSGRGEFDVMESESEWMSAISHIQSIVAAQPRWYI